MKIVLGAGATQYDGWISTQQKQLDLLKPETFEAFFQGELAEAMLAEHLFEHLTLAEGMLAAQTLYRYLQPGGWIRAAVPDRYFRNADYQRLVQIGGPGPQDHPAASHKIVYDYKQFCAVFVQAGFEVSLLEYCDERGDFHYRYANGADGYIGRSYRNDTRNACNHLGMVSIVLDAFKPIVIPREVQALDPDKIQQLKQQANSATN